MLLCDTGVLLAAGNVKDHHHAACLAQMRAAEGPLLVPSPVLGEIGYLLQSRVGPHAEVTFLKSFGGNGFHVAEVEEGDISCIAELVEQYVSLPLGIVDAAVIALTGVVSPRRATASCSTSPSDAPGSGQRFPSSKADDTADRTRGDGTGRPACTGSGKFDRHGGTAAAGSRSAGLG
ncbi:MAG: type II toxin-antitoxin system VapC family toxin [Streptosporangiaceae bacterium]